MDRGAGRRRRRRRLGRVAPVGCAVAAGRRHRRICSLLASICAEPCFPQQPTSPLLITLDCVSSTHCRHVGVCGVFVRVVIRRLRLSAPVDAGRPRRPRRRRRPCRRRSRRSRLLAFFASPQSTTTPLQAPWLVLEVTGGICGRLCARFAYVSVRKSTLG